MKKFLTLALALAMVLTLSLNVFAAEASFDATNDSQSIDVTVTKNTEEANAYYIDLKWEALTFTYTITKTWNSDHTYGVAETWDDTDGKTITVTNHSNVGIDVIAKLENGTESGTVVVKVDNNETSATAKLDPGVENQAANADSHSFNITVSGVPADNAQDVVVKQVTITIADAA